MTEHDVLRMLNIDYPEGEEGQTMEIVRRKLDEVQREVYGIESQNNRAGNHRAILFDACERAKEILFNAEREHKTTGTWPLEICEILTAAQTHYYDYWLSRQPKEAHK